MPESIVREQPNEVFDLLYKITLSGGLGAVNYFLGGKVNQFTDDGTAVHPALSSAIGNIFTNTPESNAVVYEFLPNSVTGACFNHHSSVEVEWRDALWGSKYDRLLELKGQYDPDQVFNCWHCLGYTGGEIPAPVDGNGSIAASTEECIKREVDDEED